MTTPAREPWNPYAVLAFALLMPGAGHVAVGQPQRGFGFAFFSLLLALVSWHTTTPEHSFIGRSAAGLFVWAISIPDAYRLARMKYELWRKNRR
ncbi:MAG: hypothetical protein K2Y42_01110 [Hyphomicrobium sp.]|uniref:hypothetical protein n=1 Tax=Hyphomicrobium sp. TaxID=82 RepID=UPI0025C1BD6F|nr:hypothetical protein [Hyphomicrobium sp.]MBX9861324.1 hypothetical protein [Hyphomicrobium sp.]